ncbi:MAG: cell division protein FtsQ/DivIB [Gammaproteobacteria bacterium]
MGILFSGLFAVIIFHHASISHYINRPITQVELSGIGQYVPEARANGLLQPLLGSGFFDFDVKLAKATLEEEPWVYAAAIKRSWPDTLSVAITEQVAIARWGEHGLINQYGNIFTPGANAALSTLPVLSGPDGAYGQMMEQYQRFSQILFPAGVRLTGLRLSARGSWELSINDETEIILGRLAPEEKLMRFVNFYNTQIVSSEMILESVDLRYENGIAVSSRMDLQNELAGIDGDPVLAIPEPFTSPGELEL